MHSLYANGMPRFTWSKPSEQTRLGSNADRTRVAPRTARRSPDLRHIAAESFTGVADRPRSDSRSESAPGRADREVHAGASFRRRKNQLQSQRPDRLLRRRGAYTTEWCRGPEWHPRSITRIPTRTCCVSVCTPRPSQGISLVYMHLMNCRVGRRRRRNSIAPSCSLGATGETSQLRPDHRKSLRIQRVSGFDPHRPYQKS